MKYRKKPVVIEAVQFSASEPGDPLAFDSIPQWLDEALEDGTIWRVSGDVINGGDWDFLKIKTLEGDMLVSPGDFIIQGVQGEMYPCKPDIFRQTYEPVVETVLEPGERVVPLPSNYQTPKEFKLPHIFPRPGE